MTEARRVPSLEIRALYINAYADCYFGRPVLWPDGRIASQPLSTFQQKRRAEQYDEWMFRLDAAKEWEVWYPK